MSDWLGWAATALFTSSYFCKRPETLRRVQMVGASIWVAYGVLTHALPVVAANLLVMGAAALASWGGRAKVGSGGLSRERDTILPT
jgi:hypothetical protein